MRFCPYLFFTTQCEPALEFYRDAGLGQISEVLRHGEGGMPLNDESMRGKIMHACFSGPGIQFYASDNDDAEPMRGFALMVEIADRTQIKTLMERMAEGGRVTTAFGLQPWGDYYGKIVDRFGVQWMFNCAA